MLTTAEKAISEIASHNHVFIHSGVSAPQLLIKALVDQAAKLKSGFQDIHLYQIHTEFAAPYAEEKYDDNFVLHSFFNGANIRQARKNINASYIPIFLSEIPSLFYNNLVNLDFALIQVSPPDEHGMVSLGPSVDITISAVRTAKKIIAQVNPHMPRTFGDSQFPISKINHLIECNDPIFEVRAPPISEIEKKIGENIASLIEDQATLQVGIGAIPNAALSFLKNHKDLGIHSEMFSDGIIDLYKSGVITGKYKIKHREKIVSSFVIGSKAVYDFINNNPAVLLLDAAYTNNASIISQNPKVTAINSAIEVDLTGQVCSDSIGHRVYSGVGGQMDFIRGACLSKGGKPIIALPSETKSGESKIVSTLKPGAGVVTTRAHVHYVVTEHGIANLFGKTLAERAKLMIDVAAPKHREALEKQAFQILRR